MYLDPLAAKLLDQDNSEVVPGHEAKRSDNKVSGSNLEQSCPRRSARTVKVDLLQHDVLVQVDTVEAATVVRH